MGKEMATQMNGISALFNWLVLSRAKSVVSPVYAEVNSAIKLVFTLNQLRPMP